MASTLKPVNLANPLSILRNSYSKLRSIFLLHGNVKCGFVLTPFSQNVSPKPGSNKIIQKSNRRFLSLSWAMGKSNELQNNEVVEILIDSSKIILRLTVWNDVEISKIMHGYGSVPALNIDKIWWYKNIVVLACIPLHCRPTGENSSLISPYLSKKKA